MYVPTAFHFERKPIQLPANETEAARVEPLASRVLCQICGKPIENLMELHLVAQTPVHPVCLRQMSIVNWQLRNHLPTDNSV